MPDPLKKILWANVRALMVERYGDENLNRLAREARVGPGTITRIKAMKNSTGVEVIEKVAKALRVDPYRLLLHGGTDKELSLLLKAYSGADERGKDLLNAAAEAALVRKRNNPGAADA